MRQGAMFFHQHIQLLDERLSLLRVIVMSSVNVPADKARVHVVPTYPTAGAQRLHYIVLQQGAVEVAVIEVVLAVLKRFWFHMGG